MAFKPEQYDNGRLVRLPATASISFVKGNALIAASGFYTNAAAGENLDIQYVAMETITSAATDGATFVHAIRTKDVIMVADTTTDPTRAQVGTKVDLGAAGSLDTAAVTDQQFYVEDVLLPLTDRKVRGWFVGGLPNS